MRISHHTAPYAALAERLRARIHEEKTKPGSWFGTEVNIAAESGVSRMTARKAVQTLVDEGLLERRPGLGVFVRSESPSARRVRFVAGNLLWQPAVVVSQALKERAEESRLHVSVFDGRGDVAAVVAELRSLPASGVAGAVVMTRHNPDFYRVLSEFVAVDFPFVVVGETLSELPAPSVAADNRTGGRLAAEALIAAGHRDLAFLGDRADMSRLRTLGAIDACVKARIPPPRDLTSDDARFGNWEPFIVPLLRDAIRAKERPTGFLCSCDAVARIALKTLREEGLDVPRDASLVGFDDDPISEWITPPLTTIRLDFREIGRCALKLLKRQIERHAAGGVANMPSPTLCPVTLVQRESIAPPKSK